MNDPAPSHPPVTGSAKWLDDNPAELLRAGCVARLEVRTPRKRGERVQVYNIQAVIRDGMMVAYKMWYYLGGEKEPTMYTVNIGSNGLPQHCNCRDATHRARVGGCRHERSLTFALHRIGML